MKSNDVVIAVVCSLIFLLNSCKKGDPGPAGATGPAGPTGATGVAGPTGTANVIYSNWANLTFSGSGTNWGASITAPGVTQAILDKGVVKTYFQYGSSVYDGNYNNAATSHSIYQYLYVGYINFIATFNASYPWRYVIIPGGVAGGRLSGSNSDTDTFILADGSTMSRAALDTMSYENVCSRFNIPKY
ncbi:MAG: collagen-like protein [Chitinophagaceae bacterium]